MIIQTYEDALLAVSLKLKSAEIEVPSTDLSIKPTNYLWNQVPDSKVEGGILSKQAHIHFE